MAVASAASGNGQINIVIDASAGPLERTLVRVQGRLKAFDAAVSKTGKRNNFAKMNAKLGTLNKISDTITGSLNGAAIAALIFTAATVGAGALGASALAAIPLALGGIGIAFAAMDKRVKKAFSGLKDHVSGAMKELSKPLVEPLIRAAGRLEKAFDIIAPSLGRIFKATARLVDQFTNALGPAAAAIGPVLEKAFTDGTPVLQAFGRALSPIGRGLADMLATLGDGAPALSAFVDAFGVQFGALFAALGRLIVALTPVGTLILNTLVPAIISFTDYLASLAPTLQKVTQFLADHSTTAKVVGQVLLGTVIAVKALNLAFALGSAVSVAYGVAVKALSVAMAVGRGAIAAVALAQRLMNLQWLVAAGRAAVTGAAYAAAFAFMGAAAIKNAAIQTAAAARTVIANTLISAGLIASKVAMIASTAATYGMVAAQTALNFVMSLNPFALVVIAIVALIAVLVLAWKNSETFRTIVIGAWNAIKTVGIAIFNALKTAVLTIFRAISAYVRTQIAIVKAVLMGIRSVVTAVVGFFRSLYTGAKDKIGQLLSFVRSVPGKVKSGLGNVASLLYNAGKQVIQGLINGIKNMAGAAVSAAKNVVGGAIKGAKNLLGINSPSKVFHGFGVNTIQGLINGIEAQDGALAKTMANVAKTVAGTALELAPVKASSVSELESLSSGTAANSSAPPEVNVTVVAPVGASGADIGREIQNYLNAYKREGGRVPA